MRVVAKKTLREFWEIFPDSGDALKAWFAEAEATNWQTPAEIKDKFRSASILKDSRVVFNICGSKYRLVVKISYKNAAVLIRFIGTSQSIRCYERGGSMMMPKMIKNEADYEAALATISTLMDAQPGTPEADELELHVTLVELYEKKAHPIGRPDPIEAIKFRMEQMGLKHKDMVPFFGSRSKVSEVLSRQRPLSLSMMRKLNQGLGIPAAVLLMVSSRSIDTAA